MSDKGLAKQEKNKEILFCTCDVDPDEPHQSTCPFNEPQLKKKDVTE